MMDLDYEVNTFSEYERAAIKFLIYQKDMTRKDNQKFRQGQLIKEVSNIDVHKT